MKVAVIGAGASGMVAALQAAWNGADVRLFEHNAEVGKKIQVTGSGRCNLTNDGVGAERYACADVEWMRTLLHGFGVADLIELLAGIGIPVQKTEDGWYYPISNSAQSVVEAFSNALDLAGVHVGHDCHVDAIYRNPNGWTVDYVHAEQACAEGFASVIVSAGGMAYPTLGSRGELFPALASLGHTILPKRPALAPLLANLGDLRALQGMRLNVCATLWQGHQQLASTMGNLIFTQWGLNGPAVMDLSHQVSAHGGSELELSLNALAFFQDEFDQLLAQKRDSAMSVRVFLAGFFPPKVVVTFLHMAGLREDLSMHQMDDKALHRLRDTLQNLRVVVNGVRGFEYCQVSAGGVPVHEVDPRTLESRVAQGLFLTGETLDVVGPCGGYNLQYAFSSGALAGRAAAAGRT